MSFVIYIKYATLVYKNMPRKTTKTELKTKDIKIEVEKEYTEIPEIFSDEYIDNPKNKYLSIKNELFYLSYNEGRLYFGIDSKGPKINKYVKNFSIDDEKHMIIFTYDGPWDGYDKTGHIIVKYKITMLLNKDFQIVKNIFTGV